MYYHGFMIKQPMGCAQRALLERALVEMKRYDKVRCADARQRQYAEKLALRGFMRRLSYSYFALTHEGKAEAIKLKGK